MTGRALDWTSEIGPRPKPKRLTRLVEQSAPAPARTTTAALDVSRLEKVRNIGSKTIAQCPACAEVGGDASGEHLLIAADGRFACVKYPGPDGEAHRKRIFALAGVTEKREAPAAKARIVKIYDYINGAGKLVFQVCRFEPKGFRQRRPDGKGGWIWNMTGVDRVLYRLPSVIKAAKAGQVIHLAEGEKDVDAIVGLGLCATCSPGGAGKWQDSYTSTLTGAQVIIIAHKDEPGRKHASLLRDAIKSKAASVSVIELPDRNGCHVKDAADWIQAGGAVEELQEIVRNAPARTTLAPVEIGDINLQAWFFKIQQVKGLTAGERYQQMAAAVLETLHARGRFFFHTEHRDFATAMYFDRKRKLLLPIAGDPFLSWLSGFIGINRTERAFQFILAAIQDEALTGKTTGLLPESFWAARPGTFYLSNGDGHLVKITPEAMTQADNGTDEILFPAGDTLAPWKLIEPANPFDQCALFKSMNTTAPHGKILFQLWVCALTSNQRTKPPLVLSGPIGAGKTRLAVGIAELYGLPPRIATITKNGEEDFWTQAHAGGMICFDNADTRTDWLADALAAAATDGCREKRRLYTDTARIVQRARAWTVITSANPTFAADAGLADRILVVRLDRRTDETAEAALSDEIAAHRDAGLSWIAEVLSVALADKTPVLGGLNKRHPDFSALAVRMGRAMGKEKEAIEAIRNAEADKSLFNLENDEVGAAMIELMRANDTFAGTAAELLDQLKTIDSTFEGRLSAKRLAKRLGRLWPHLAAVFSAKQEKGHGGFNQLFFRRPNGDFGDFETAFSGKSYETIIAGRNTKTPLESHQSHQEPLFEHTTAQQ